MIDVVTVEPHNFGSGGDSDRVRAESKQLNGDLFGGGRR